MFVTSTSKPQQFPVDQANKFQLRSLWAVRPRIFGYEIRSSVREQSLTLVEFDFRVIGDGRSATARYANNSNYRNDSLIRKESRCRRPQQ